MPGRIPLPVFEELLVNALIHREYLVSATIRIFVYDNRIEIISPGHLPNNLTVESIKAGVSNIRNPILVSYIAKGLLPYKGLGSGIKRALENWPDIEFTDDRDRCLFIATIRRKPVAESERFADISSQTSSPKGTTKDASEKMSGKTCEKQDLHGENHKKRRGKVQESSGKTSGKILKAIHSNGMITIPELSIVIGVTERSIERNIHNLQRTRRLRRIGPAKGGYWQIIE